MCELGAAVDLAAAAGLGLCLVFGDDHAIDDGRAQIEGDGYFGIRFYAMRDQDGAPGADCRINGEDYEPGMAALRSYVDTWPGSGFEFRKQYVFVFTPAPTS